MAEPPVPTKATAWGDPVSPPRYRPRVSIITPTFDSEATLHKTLDSVSSQRFEGLEYLIVDGGSSDRTCEMIAACPAVNRWISEPDDGIADAFNKGIENSSGELIGIINSDDWYEPGALSRVWSVYESLPVQTRDRTILHGDMIFHESTGRNRFRHPRFSGSGRWHWSFYFDMPIHHPTCFVPAAIYKLLGLYRTDFQIAMDFEWILRAWKTGATFRYVPEVIANFRAGGASSTHTQAALREVYRAQRSHSLPFIPITTAYVAKTMVNRLKQFVR